MFIKISKKCLDLNFIRITYLQDLVAGITKK